MPMIVSVGFASSGTNPASPNSNSDMTQTTDMGTSRDTARSASEHSEDNFGDSSTAYVNLETENHKSTSETTAPNITGNDVRRKFHWNGRDPDKADRHGDQIHKHRPRLNGTPKSSSSLSAHDKFVFTEEFRARVSGLRGGRNHGLLTESYDDYGNISRILT